MGTRFHGWPEPASTVLLELEGEPSRATRERVRSDREQHVRQPMIDLLNEIGGDVMKRIPRGYPPDHPRAGLLRHRSLTAARELQTSAVNGAEPVYRSCERLRPLLSWLATHTAAAPR